MTRLPLTLFALAASACTPSDPERYDGPLPNVVVVTLDTLRADHLGCYGYFRDTSPTLDSIASESLVFERCLTPVSQTLPTHTTLFTGLYPYEHGVLANVLKRKVPELSASVETLASATAAAGYETAGFVAAQPLKRGNGLERDFAAWWEPEERDAPADQIVNEALGWLDDWNERGRTVPFFVWLHLFDAHAPYAPPPPFDEMFTSDEALDAYLERLAISEFVESHLPAFRGDSRTEHNRYDGEIRYLDGELGRFVGRLRALELWTDALVVVTGDHGEGLKQHHTNGHGHVWLESLHVPFMIKAPGLAPGRNDLWLGSVDVIPTAVGREPALAAKLAGWLAQASGRDVLGGEHEPGPVFSHFSANKRPIAYAVVQDHWRLTVGDGEPRLFHLTEDPHELVDLAAELPGRVEELRNVLAAGMTQQKERGEAFESGKLRDASPEALSALEELGYGGDDGGDDAEED